MAVDKQNILEGEIITDEQASKALVSVSTNLAKVSSYEDSLDAYLSKISNVPLLSKEDEVEYARRYRDHKDMQAAQYLVLSNLRFVVYVAKGFKGYGLPLADIIQEGNLGLMKAVEKFDPEQNVRFISYAVYWIRCDINEYIIKNMRMVKSVTSKNRRKLLFNLSKHMKSGASFTYAQRQDLAEQYGVSVQDIDIVEAALSNHDASIEFSTPQGQATLEMLPDSSHTPEKDYAEAHKDKQHTSLISSLLSQLNDRQREIIQARWLSSSKASLESLAEKYGISMQRVSQIEKQALEKCRATNIAVEELLLTSE